MHREALINERSRVDQSPRISLSLVTRSPAEILLVYLDLRSGYHGRISNLRTGGSRRERLSRVATVEEHVSVILFPFSYATAFRETANHPRQSLLIQTTRKVSLLLRSSLESSRFSWENA